MVAAELSAISSIALAGVGYRKPGIDRSSRPRFTWLTSPSSPSMRFTDFNTNSGQQLAPWAQNYVTYILPASPVIVAIHVVGFVGAR
ncbi:MAG: hypothetical protein QM730_15295 [Anaerolineales bacterium]